MRKNRTQTFDNKVDTSIPVRQDNSWFSVEQLYITVGIVIIVVGFVVGSSF